LVQLDAPREELLRRVKALAAAEEAAAAAASPPGSAGAGGRGASGGAGAASASAAAPRGGAKRPAGSAAGVGSGGSAEGDAAASAAVPQRSHNTERDFARRYDAWRAALAEDAADLAGRVRHRVGSNRGEPMPAAAEDQGCSQPSHCSPTRSRQQASVLAAAAAAAAGAAPGSADSSKPQRTPRGAKGSGGGGSGGGYAAPAPAAAPAAPAAPVPGNEEQQGSSEAGILPEAAPPEAAEAGPPLPEHGGLVALLEEAGRWLPGRPHVARET
jgi:hypothetical protein